ncbi:thioredoxin family protein [Kiritimatiella glycovorans]|uniref:Putative peroxiredoxin n=1 Tax=Kiritimatiella glycovorans TaxID=1307763 RepID=A0A0G3EL37_9BACT|nr:thioredoxin family protein [Kiritimatiella glycovorans]AKJ65480.1 putative peroxiredoxin [Kiritimatiella glycovorans]
MVETASTMMELGEEAPGFNLPDVRTGEQVSLESFRDCEALLVMFICRHCPFVKHVEGGLARIAKEYRPEGLGAVAISANDPGTHPDDRPESLKEQAEEQGFDFPYLFDETQETAKAYRAACTPDLYLFDAGRKLVYRGQLDDSRPGSGRPVTGSDLREAVDAVLEGREVPSNQRPSTGCNIKWKPGNEPPYFG